MAAKKKSQAKKASAKKPAAKKAARSAGPKQASKGAPDVVYSDVRRSLRSGLLGRLLGS
jgi:hypothetical protein